MDASKPVVRDLRPLLADLRPFARDSAPAFRDLANAIRKPGKGNDLVELLRAQVPLDKAANDEVQANGATRRAAFPELAQSMRDSTPQVAYFRPYAVDLTGWFDDFSTSGQTDALGNFSRAGLALSSFTVTHRRADRPRAARAARRRARRRRQARPQQPLPGLDRARHRRPLGQLEAERRLQLRPVPGSGGPVRRAAVIVFALALAAAGLVSASGAGGKEETGTYKIVFDNAFGVVKGADFKVGGVAVGSISELDVSRERRARPDHRLGQGQGLRVAARPTPSARSSRSR